VLVLEADTEQHAQHDPAPRLVGAQHAREHEKCRGPDETVVRVHRHERRNAEQDGGKAHGQRGDALAKPASAQFARQERSNDDADGVRDRRREPQRDDRITQDEASERRDHRDQRRMIDIPPVEPGRAGKVVELVTEPAITSDRDEMQEERSRGEGHRETREWRDSVHTVRRVPYFAAFSIASAAGESGQIGSGGAAYSA